MEQLFAVSPGMPSAGRAGWRDLLAGAVGIWLFYVQHQFEEAYWEPSLDRTYADAALRGSSYLKLPEVSST